MIRLSREIRFSLTNDFFDVKNSWAGWPISHQTAPHLALRCVVCGTPNPKTGYLCDIKDLDLLLRTIVVDDLIPHLDQHPNIESLITTIFRRALQSWNSPAAIEEISLRPSAFLDFQILTRSPNMIQLTQQFEFSAAHRLHSPDLTADENRAVYGKCNNPNGHGHNYVVEVTIAQNNCPSTGALIELGKFQDTVNRLIIDRLDHKHLNLDVDYFRNVIPSVENISIAIWDWLDGQFDTAQLSKIRVYETPKTWAEYSGHSPNINQALLASRE